MATFDDFMQVDIRVGEVLRCKRFEKAKKPAYQLWIDFGEEIGVKQSSAQITACYQPEDLVGRQVFGVVNFPPMRIAGFVSEVLVLGSYSDQGVVLAVPEQSVRKGDRLG